MQDETVQAHGAVAHHQSRGEPAPEASAAGAAPPGSISFAVVTVGDGPRILPLLDVLGSAMRDNDEVVLLLRDDQAQTLTHRPPWARVVTVPDASIFRLRAQVPAVCRNEWIVALEDHSMIDQNSIDAIRRVIRERPDIDIIPFLTKNLTSRRTWDWAIYLFNFALVWAPLAHPPPFSIVTSAIVRRAALKTTDPLKDGEWELRVIPGLFATGRRESSNDIFIDHIKPLDVIPALAIIFHNARAGASLQRSFGISAHSVLREGWFAFAPRPRMLMKAVAPRAHELPAGTRLRLHALGLSHLIGNMAGILFGGGRSAYNLD